MSGDNPVLPAGQYVYPFQFQLPQLLPSSYEGGVGHVRYQLKATIDLAPSGDESDGHLQVLGMLEVLSFEVSEAASPSPTVSSNAASNSEASLRLNASMKSG